MKKSVEVLLWVFFVSQGLKDDCDLMRAQLLLLEIERQGELATVESIKKSSGYLSCIHDIPYSLIDDVKIQEMIDF